MNTLVMNTDTGAVTEYDTPFTGLSGDIETTDEGVYVVGGELDDGAVVAVSFTFGLLLAGSTRRRARYLYLFGERLGNLVAQVDTTSGSFEYTGSVTHDRVTRFDLGRGIRDNYLSFTVKSSAAETFVLDRLSAETTESTNRRL